MNNEDLENLIEQLKKVPGISKKQAMKILFFLIETPMEEIENFLNLIREFKKNTHYCEKCGYLNSNLICKMCLNSQRSLKILVVEHSDIVTKFEESGKFDGKYFVFGKYDKKNLEKLDERVKKLASFVSDQSEIILAFSSTIDGLILTNFLAKHPFFTGKKITKLAIGVPFGATIDYVDSLTLDQALKNRQKVEN
ncbi:toprim domain-containing protein [Mycoplasma sp. 'Moose RK']|uniref:toprim domain-containing protein n=1 Tax=Mycoplasma sp. 'Moose RK' TaxID=2780095 RepID=UPI0018C2AF11|nr:toprim domain-containing protein [Mycoplasma sp. 'Moose RK']MBG0730987.1 recombination protein RecR [Mycoplasma sp. 'Moose RK']